jgi:hypothetical protein
MSFLSMESNKSKLQHKVTPEKNALDEQSDDSFEEDLSNLSIFHDSNSRWTDGALNLALFALYAVLQVNAVIKIRTLYFDALLSGVVLFLAVFVAELLLLVQPRDFMFWIPFWQNSFGRGYVHYVSFCYTHLTYNVFSLYALSYSIHIYTYTHIHI